MSINKAIFAQFYEAYCTHNNIEDMETNKVAFDNAVELYEKAQALFSEGMNYHGSQLDASKYYQEIYWRIRVPDDLDLKEYEDMSERLYIFSRLDTDSEIGTYDASKGWDL